MLYLCQELGAGTNTALLRCVKQLLSPASWKQHWHQRHYWNQTAVIYWW